MSAKEKTKRPRLSIIPARAVTDPNISAQALRVLALLGRHTDDDGWCFRSQVRMAEELSVSRGTIQNALGELIGPTNGSSYVEKREQTRPGVREQIGRHPHCSYAYRVRLDLDDDIAAGASQLAPSRANQLAGGASQEKHPVPDSLAPLTERLLDNVPLGNSRPAGAGESEVASLQKGNTERWPEFRSAVAKTWPKGFPAADEIACSRAFESVTRRHPPRLVIACAALHGAVLTRQAAERRAPGPLLVKKPSNWLKEREWEGYIPQAEAEAAQGTAESINLARVRASLGAETFEKLKNIGISEQELAKFGAVQFSADPTPSFAAPPWPASRLRLRALALQREFGGDLTIVEIAERRAS